MAKQRQSAAPAAVMHLVKLRWQAKCQATLRVPLPANSPALRRGLFQANSREKAAGSPSPFLQRLRPVGWGLPLLEPQD
jgi:hypothetical protein